MNLLLVQALVIFLGISIIIGGYFLLRKKQKAINNLIYCLSVILAVVFFVRYMWGSEAISQTFKLKGNVFGYTNKIVTLITTIIIWFTYAGVLLVILQPFFKINFVNHLIKFFVLPLGVFSAFWIKFSTMGVVGANVYKANVSAVWYMRGVLLAVEVAILVGFSFITLWQNQKFKSSKKDWIKTIYALPLLILCAIPPYALRAIFGNFIINRPIKDLNEIHRFVLYFAFIVPLLIYFLLRKKHDKVIKFSLLYLSLGALITFSFEHKINSFYSPLSWPLHLCNTAMYIVPLCIIFKWEKLMYFTVFINVLGAFFAMAMPNYSADLNLFSIRINTFFISHYNAFYMPFLMIALKMYPRPKLKHFIYSMVAFAIYFFSIVFINAWFSNYGSVDYFYVNSDFIASKLGKWAEDLRDITWEFTIKDLKFVLYPLYQILFFLVYVVLGLLMWFIYKLCYKVADGFGDLAIKKHILQEEHILLKKKLNGRDLTSPMDLKWSDKLVINNFSKKYGENKNYAVEKANLEVCRGEIFGFLGPNGAGKSTIIKSIVGLQSITEGSISVFGYDVEKQSVMAKMQIGFVPDHYALYEKLTGREYLNYIADLYDVSQEDRDLRLNKYLSILQLEHAIDNQIKTYSHGMKQKIAIISALIHNPKLWILDEPLTGLDPTSIYQIKKCMFEHAQNGNIVFFSSHIIDVVEKICDRIAVIKKGKICAVEKIEDVEKNDTLENFYLKIIGQSEQGDNNG